MSHNRPTRIALSGQVGSGKSAVGSKLALALGYDYLSTGAIQRAIAARRGLTTLELNQVAATDPSIDKEIDDFLKIDVNAMTRVVVDSRMAFLFVNTAIKVSLVIDPTVAVARVMNAQRAEERYDTMTIAAAAIAERNRLERERFEQLYHVNLHSLRNYDIVIDTSTASIDAVVSMVKAEVNAFDAAGAKPRCWLSAHRVFPALSGWVDAHSTDEVCVIEVDRTFFVVAGSEALRSALAVGTEQVACRLIACGDEAMPGLGLTARAHAATACTPAAVAAWERDNAMRFGHAPFAG